MLSGSYHWSSTVSMKYWLPSSQNRRGRSSAFRPESHSTSTSSSQLSSGTTSALGQLHRCLLSELRDGKVSTISCAVISALRGNQPCAVLGKITPNMRAMCERLQHTRHRSRGLSLTTSQSAQKTASCRATALRVRPRLRSAIHLVGLTGGSSTIQYCPRLGPSLCERFPDLWRERGVS